MEAFPLPGIRLAETSTEEMRHGGISSEGVCGRSLLYQHVRERTSARGKDTSSILHLISTYDRLEIDDIIIYAAPLWRSDHPGLDFQYVVYEELRKEENSRPNREAAKLDLTTLGTCTGRPNFKI